MFSYIEVASSLTQEIILPLRRKNCHRRFFLFEPLQSYLFRHSRLEMQFRSVPMPKRPAFWSKYRPYRGCSSGGNRFRPRKTPILGAISYSEALVVIPWTYSSPSMRLLMLKQFHQSWCGGPPGPFLQCAMFFWPSNRSQFSYNLILTDEFVSAVQHQPHRIV